MIGDGCLYAIINIDISSQNDALDYHLTCLSDLMLCQTSLSGLKFVVLNFPSDSMAFLRRRINFKVTILTMC